MSSVSFCNKVIEVLNQNGHPSTRSLLTCATIDAVWVSGFRLSHNGLSIASTNCARQCNWLQWFADWTGWSWPLADSVVALPPNILWYTTLVFRIGFICCISHIHLAAIPRLYHILLKWAEFQSLAGVTESVCLGSTYQG